MALHQLLPVGACFILMLDFRVLQRWRTVTLGLASVGLLVQALPHPCLGVVTLSTMTVTFSSFYHIFISHPASIASLALPRHSSSWAGQSMINPHFFFTCCVHHLRYFSDFLAVQQAGSEDEAASSSGEEEDAEAKAARLGRRIADGSAAATRATSSRARDVSGKASRKKRKREVNAREAAEEEDGRDNRMASSSGRVAVDQGNFSLGRVHTC